MELTLKLTVEEINAILQVMGDLPKRTIPPVEPVKKKPIEYKKE